MLQTPNFTEEDSFANTLRKRGFDSVREKLAEKTEEEVRHLFDKSTSYPSEIRPGILTGKFLQDVLSNSSWDAFPKTIELPSYGYADNIEQLEPLFQYLESLDKVFCVLVYTAEVNAEKPWKDGRHINTGCEEYAGKEVLKYEVWEKIK